MTEPVPTADEAALQRRRFLRGGALLAAATGGAVVASAGSALPAAAEPVTYVRLGAQNTATTTTALATTGATPALTLTNPDGPTLLLTPVAESSTWNGDLPVGGLLTTASGPLVGIEDEDGQGYTDWLATGGDLAGTPTTAPVEPHRIWDSKAKKGIVVGSSAKAVDSKGRLVKGAWVDIKVAATDLETTPIGAFVTLGSSGSSKDGSLTAYAPGSRPGTISLSFLKGKSLAAGAYVGLGVSGKSFVLRVYASQTTYVTVDLTGLTSLGFPGPDHVDGARRAGSPKALQASRAARRTAGRG